MRHWSLIRIECRPLTIRFKCFEAIAWRNAKVGQHARLIQRTQFSQSHILDVRR
jgi:hypothetical protein